jgi:arylsulfatase A-like enzyme
LACGADALAREVTAGKVSSDPVHMTDLLPTFLAAAGDEKAERNIDRRDLLPL